MALTYGFYDSLNHDRVYSANQMSEIFNGIITDGVFENIGEHFAVVAGTGMQVVVRPGRAWFDGTWTLLDTPMTLDIGASSSLLGRIDAVVLETNFDVETRANSIKVVKGTPSADPVAPTLTESELVNQHLLAYVNVDAGVTAITNRMIDIQVGVYGETPYITSVLQQTSISSLYLKWEDEWYTWFENVKTTLSGDVAANLQANIDALAKTIGDVGNLQLWEKKISIADDSAIIGNSYIRLIRGDPIAQKYACLSMSYSTSKSATRCSIQTLMPFPDKPNYIPITYQDRSDGYASPYGDRASALIIDDNGTFTPKMGQVMSISSAIDNTYNISLDIDSDILVAGVASDLHYASYTTGTIGVRRGTLSEWLTNYYARVADGTLYSTPYPKLDGSEYTTETTYGLLLLTPESKIYKVYGYTVPDPRAVSSYSYMSYVVLVATNAYKYGGAEFVSYNNHVPNNVSTSYVNTAPLDMSARHSGTASNVAETGLAYVGDVHLGKHKSTPITCTIVKNFSIVDGSVTFDPEDVISMIQDGSVDSINSALAALPSNNTYYARIRIDGAESKCALYRVTNRSVLSIPNNGTAVYSPPQYVADAWFDCTNPSSPIVGIEAISSKSYDPDVYPYQDSYFADYQPDYTVDYHVEYTSTYVRKTPSRSVAAVLCNATGMYVAATSSTTYTYVGRIGDGGPCYTDCYYGTGTCGIDGPNYAYSPFKPRLMLLLAMVTWLAEDDYVIDWLPGNAFSPMIYGEQLDENYHKVGPGYFTRMNSYAKWDEENGLVTWYSDNPTDQFNDSFVTMVDVGGSSADKRYLTQYWYMCV